MSALLHPQYITDETGKRVSVVLPMGEYTELLEDVDDLSAMAERRDEDSIVHDELVAGLKRDGLL